MNPYVDKKILVLSGEVDKTVPWACGGEVVQNLNVGAKGMKKVVVYPGVGNTCMDAMVIEMAEFLWEHALKASGREREKDRRTQ